ncbi:MAG TPA: enolase C-terminal domain-like protein [Gaiellaceae bacterium]|nr:enolase C-terminal domain-like protein [Gaiellaceae bacterium]
MRAVAERVDVDVRDLKAFAFTIPTDKPESDGTIEWSSTTLVLVEASAGDTTGFGWTYGAAAAAALIRDVLAPLVVGRSALDVPATNLALRAALRNVGYRGIGATAVSAVDVALWDLKAKLLNTSLVALLGAVRDAVPVYGSGGFCSYTDAELATQLAGWVEQGIPRVKMKVGREPHRDPGRVRTAREAIGGDAELYVDANGALTVKGAVRCGQAFDESRVSWFEEPVSSDDRDGLRRLRELLPAGMEVAAGEYAYTACDFHDLLGCVDCLQADVTRCGGITGVLAAGVLAAASELDLSGHTAPTIHAHALCAVERVRHLEWFVDHVRIERRYFDGFLEPANGVVRPDRSRPGLGVEPRVDDLEAFAA